MKNKWKKRRERNKIEGKESTRIRKTQYKVRTTERKVQEKKEKNKEKRRKQLLKETTKNNARILSKSTFLLSASLTCSFISHKTLLLK
jgi:hypothetical protein